MEKSALVAKAIHLIPVVKLAPHNNQKSIHGCIGLASLSAA
jgi:hypothetical protein